jgi:hypothetical protein
MIFYGANTEAQTDVFGKGECSSVTANMLFGRTTCLYPSTASQDADRNDTSCTYPFSSASDFRFVLSAVYMFALSKFRSFQTPGSQTRRYIIYNNSFLGI